MAREVQDREDLLRDGKALVPRVELQVEIDEQTVTVVAGFRAHGALSLYFDAEPVYHFNSRNQLRRAFVDDRLVKAERGRLIALRRVQSNTSSTLLRHEMTDAEQSELCRRLQDYLQALGQALAANRYVAAGQIPEDSDVVIQLQGWLGRLKEVTIAESPRVG